MLTLLALAVLLLTALDHWTTWLCLQAAAPGFQVSESNPFAARLFQSLGLAGGLWIDGVVTLGAVAFVAATSQLSRTVKLFVLGATGAWTAAAVSNNLAAMAVLGLLPLGSR
jgi:hypothetical protein